MYVPVKILRYSIVSIAFKYDNPHNFQRSNAILDLLCDFTAVIAALKNKRNSLCLVSSDDLEFNAKMNLAKFVK